MSGDSYIRAKLEQIRIGLGISEDAFYDMTLTQLTTLRAQRAEDGSKSVTLHCGVKWTRGELNEIAQGKDAIAALEVIETLNDRGPRVVDWGENVKRADGTVIGQEAARRFPRE